MRATVVKRLMRERGLRFKRALKDAIRPDSVSAPSAVRVETYDMGEPLVDVTKALRIAVELDDRDFGRFAGVRRRLPE